MRIALAVMLAITAGSCRTTVARGQVAPPDSAGKLAAQQDTILQSASLLKRLAEAADGYRDGKQRYVVAALEFPHKVLGVFTRKDQADDIARDSTTNTLHYATFGPYVTEAEESVSRKVDDVKYIVVYYIDGSKKTYDGRTYDALFWGMSAFDKFVAPYLTEVSGAPYASSQRELYKAGRLSHSVLPHKRYSF
jgi:hypothetical protein